MRFSLMQCLTFMLVVALIAGMITSHVRHERRIQALRNAIDDSRETLHTIEYGAANLRLLELNPAVSEDRDCSQFLKHELAFSILEHWRDRAGIDDAVGTPGYAIDFTSRALSFFDCRSAAEFVALTKSELWVYPDDGLLYSAHDLSDTELASFDEFIGLALDSCP